MTVTGDVRPCYYAMRPVGSVLAAGSFEGIWNGHVMREVRTRIRDGWVHPICHGAGCSFVRDTERRFALNAYRLDYEYGAIVRPGEIALHLR